MDQQLLRYVDERWLAKDFDALGFKLEDKFRGYKTNRVELIHSRQYTRFDDGFWSAVKADAS